MPAVLLVEDLALVGHESFECIMVEEVGDFTDCAHVVDEPAEGLFIVFIVSEDKCVQLVDYTCSPMELVEFGQEIIGRVVMTRNDLEDRVVQNR